MTMHDPGNYLPRIDSLWAVLSVDAGGEGLCAAPLAPGMLSVPLIAADEARLESILLIAREIAKRTGKTVRVVRFHAREEIEVIAP